MDLIYCPPLGSTVPLLGNADETSLGGFKGDTYIFIQMTFSGSNLLPDRAVLGYLHYIFSWVVGYVNGNPFTVITE